MKRKFAMMVLVATMAASMMTGCRAKSDNAGAAQQEETTQQEGTATEGQSEETSTFTGTLDEVKDFMFIVTGEDGTCYEFTFDEEKPEGLDSVNVGDKVTVTYTGTVSEVDPFEGEVLSVEAAK